MAATPTSFDLSASFDAFPAELESMPSASSAGVDDLAGAIARAAGLQVHHTLAPDDLPLVPALPSLEVPQGPPTTIVPFERTLEEELEEVLAGDQSANEKSPQLQDDVLGRQHGASARSSNTQSGFEPSSGVGQLRVDPCTNGQHTSVGRANIEPGF